MVSGKARVIFPFTYTGYAPSSRVKFSGKHEGRCRLRFVLISEGDAARNQPEDFLERVAMLGQMVYIGVVWDNIRHSPAIGYDSSSRFNFELSVSVFPLSLRYLLNRSHGYQRLYSDVHVHDEPAVLSLHNPFNIY